MHTTSSPEYDLLQLCSVASFPFCLNPVLTLIELAREKNRNKERDLGLVPCFALFSASPRVTSSLRLSACGPFAAELPVKLCTAGVRAFLGPDSGDREVLRE